MSDNRQNASFRLLVSRLDGNFETYDVGQMPITVGRAVDCDIHIPEAKVSRHHCVFVARMGRLHIQDQGSANGIRVNRVKVQHARLKYEDTVEVGSVVVRVKTVPGAAKKPKSVARSTSSSPAPPHTPAPGERRDARYPATITRIIKLSAALAAATETSDAATATLALVIDSIPVERGFVMMPDRETGELTVVASRTRDARPAHDGPDKELVDRARSKGSLVHNLAERPGTPAELPGAVGDAMATVMRYDGNLVGILCVEATERGLLTLDMLIAFDGIAGQAAQVMGRIEARTDRFVEDIKTPTATESKNVERALRDAMASSEQQRLDAILRLRELETLRTAREKLANRLIHETRLTLGPVVDSLDGMRKSGALGPGAALVLGEAVEGIEQMMTHSQNVLVIAELENGVGGLSVSTASVAELLRSTVTRNKTSAATRGVELNVHNGPVDHVTSVDTNLIGRALDAVLGEAFRTAGRKGQVALAAEHTEAGTEITVSATPAGIKEERVTSSQRLPPQAQPSGLTALLCRLVTEAHGGSCRREIEKGVTRWILTLRLTRDDALESTHVEDE